MLFPNLCAQPKCQGQRRKRNEARVPRIERSILIDIAARTPGAIHYHRSRSLSESPREFNEAPIPKRRPNEVGFGLPESSAVPNHEDRDQDENHPEAVLKNIAPKIGRNGVKIEPILIKRIHRIKGTRSWLHRAPRLKKHRSQGKEAHPEESREKKLENFTRSFCCFWHFTCQSVSHCLCYLNPKMTPGKEPKLHVEFKSRSASA